MIDMGTFASQINQDGQLKIDLKSIHLKYPDRTYEIFNELMIEQKKQLDGSLLKR